MNQSTLDELVELADNDIRAILGYLMHSALRKTTLRYDDVRRAGA